MNASESPQARIPGGPDAEQQAAPSVRRNDPHRAEMLAQAKQVRARFHTFTNTARAILEDEPSAHLVRTAARHLTATVGQLAEEIAGRRTC